MTTSAELRTLFVDALTGATDAGTAVYSPFTWPTASNSFPLMLVRAPKERKESLGRNAPLFTVTTTIEIIARTKSPALVGDAGSAVALAAAEALKLQIEVALINNPAIWADPNGGQRIQQFTSVESEISASSEGDMPMAELLMHVEVEFAQGPEDFFPLPSTPLDGFDVTVQEPSGTTEPYFTIELPQPIS
ncbi:ABC transporter permease [Paraburkholderia aromaticivorans]|uniref:ABC transporter permease n=1 Tax=Paraburkholderia aromaticivorans TaxID=2026199 RepID=A0A248VP38_9BURK|nr:ABC transporter permease [Paraburkholderia aromaticivorans]